MSDPLEGTGYRALAAASADGWVREAEQLATGRSVTATFLPKEILSLPEIADRLRLETQIVSRLAHPNVLEVLGLGMTRAGFPVLFTERPPGRTLATELASRGTLGAEEAIGWATQALAGLSATHAAGVVHRDVRPETLLLRGAPERQQGRDARTLQVAAVGVAPLIAAADPARLAAGWARYLSPEQALGQETDERVDIYAMGLVLYKMLVGTDPFAHCSLPIELLRAHATEVPGPPSRRSPQLVPPEVEAVVLRALAKRPEDRWRSAREFGEALAGALGPGRVELRALIRTEPTARTNASTSLGNPSLAELARRIAQQASDPSSARPAPESGPKATLPETLNMSEGMPLPAASPRSPQPDPSSRSLLAGLVAGGISLALSTAAFELARAVLR